MVQVALSPDTPTNKWKRLAQKEIDLYAGLDRTTGSQLVDNDAALCMTTKKGKYRTQGKMILSNVFNRANWA
eukprot:11939365-Ditylum_brightwellii.AAC.1